MEPVTIFLLMLFALSGTGAARVGYRKHQHKQRERLRQALLTPLSLPGQLLSVYDLFWDLGVSEYALEIMASRGLLPASPETLGAARQNMLDQIMDHGSYEAFVHDLLEAIQEFYREHQRAGHRRQLPTLRLESVKLLPAPQSMAQAPPSASSEALVRHTSTLAPPGELPDGYLLDIGLAQRSQWRSARSSEKQWLERDAAGGAGVDIDALLKHSPGRLLQSLFQGTLKREASRWLKLSKLRQLKAELDAALIRMFERFEWALAQNPAFFEPIYDLTRRWQQESARIEQLERARPWRERAWASAADVLAQEAKIMARLLATHAKQNADEAIAKLRDHARRGDLAMAGYLVYINHYAFMAGYRDDYSDLVRAVEFTTHKIQQEMGQLRAQGVL